MFEGISTTKLYPAPPSKPKSGGFPDKAIIGLIAAFFGLLYIYYRLEKKFGKRFESWWNWWKQSDSNHHNSKPRPRQWPPQIKQHFFEIQTFNSQNQRRSPLYRSRLTCAKLIDCRLRGIIWNARMREYGGFESSKFSLLSVHQSMRGRWRLLHPIVLWRSSVSLIDIIIWSKSAKIK